MNVSISSKNSWYTPAEKVRSSMSLMGLPTEYPVYGKNPVFTSTALGKEELEDFELLGGNYQHCSTKRHPRSYVSPSVSMDENPLKLHNSNCSYIESSVSSSSNSSSSSETKRSQHRRQRTEIGSFDDFLAMTKRSKARRRQRNQALSPKDFQEKILTQLFEDVSCRPEEEEEEEFRHGP